MVKWNIWVSCEICIRWQISIVGNYYLLRDTSNVDFNNFRESTNMYFWFGLQITRQHIPNTTSAHLSEHSEGWREKRHFNYSPCGSRRIMEVNRIVSNPIFPVVCLLMAPSNRRSTKIDQNFAVNIYTPTDWTVRRVNELSF